MHVKVHINDLQCAQGEIFATGSCTSEIGYFRIRLNTYNSVETVTCFSRKVTVFFIQRENILFQAICVEYTFVLSRKELWRYNFYLVILQIFRVRDMITLYGKHESMLNELRFRFRVSAADE